MLTADVRDQDWEGSTLLVSTLEEHGLRLQDAQYAVYGALWAKGPSFFYQATNTAEQALLEEASAARLVCGLYVSAQALEILRNRCSARRIAARGRGGLS
jgi:hypothetical protein